MVGVKNISPFIAENFFDHHMMGLLKFQIDLLKKSNLQTDKDVFFRKQIHNHPLLKVLHDNMADLASAMFDEELKPSYVFLSMYFTGQGKCPLHVDRPQCYRTIDVLINKVGDWPIFVNHEDEWTEDKIGQNRIIKNSKGYRMSEGDALCYSGTNHPHFRPDAHKDEGADLIFFHFVPKDFEGDLN